MDSPDKCYDRDHFANYQHVVEYRYNSRGFRDSEWPSDLSNAIWCLGDSFTVGIGSPLEHTWPKVLQHTTGRRCVNVSLDGASNSWIGRRAAQILREIKPFAIVIHWSFLHRTENPDTSKTDEERREQFDINSIRLVKQLEAFMQAVDTVESAKGTSRVIYSHIPVGMPLLTSDAANQLWETLRGQSWVTLPNSVSEFESLPTFIAHELKKFNNYETILDLLECFESPCHREYQNYLLKNNVIPEFKILDLARDGFHYDVKTATAFVDEILKLL